MSYTYTYVPNGNLETGKPARAVDIRAIRDMAPAIVAGVDGAPQITHFSLGRLTAGDVERVRYDGEIQGTDPTLSFSMSQRGSFRLSFEHMAQGNLNATRARVHVINLATRVEVEVGSWPGSGSYVRRILDVPFGISNVVRVSVRRGDTASVALLRNVIISTGGEYIWSSGFGLELA